MKDCLLTNTVWVENDKSQSKSATTNPVTPSSSAKSPSGEEAPSASKHATPSSSPPTTQTTLLVVAASSSSPAAPPLDSSFEDDLQEILSPSPPSPSTLLPSPTLSLPPSASETPSSSSLPVSSSIIPIPPSLDRNLSPFKPKNPLKRPKPLSPPTLTLFNPFALLENPQNKALKLTETSDPSNLSKFTFSDFSPPSFTLTSSASPLLLSSTADEPVPPSEEASHQSL